MNKVGADKQKELKELLSKYLKQRKSMKMEKLLFISWIGEDGVRIGIGVFEDENTKFRAVLVAPVKGLNEKDDIEFIREHGVQIDLSTLGILSDIAQDI